MRYIKRYVSSHFWDDPFVVNLNPTEKLIFLYLFTNSLFKPSGIYEISLKRIACDTGIEQNIVKKILKRFQDAGKVYYTQGIIYIPKGVIK